MTKTQFSSEASSLSSHEFGSRIGQTTKRNFNFFCKWVLISQPLGPAVTSPIPNRKKKIPKILSKVQPQWRGRPDCPLSGGPPPPPPSAGGRAWCAGSVRPSRSARRCVRRRRRRRRRVTADFTRFPAVAAAAAARRRRRARARAAAPAPAPHAPPRDPRRPAGRL
jgi:hypothetical protein